MQNKNNANTFIYELNKVNEQGESFYNEMLPDVIKECEEKKIVTEDQGAKCIFVGKPYKNPLIILKSDGGYNYDSTDMACIKYRC